jgi:hypothetical protein
MRPPKSRIHYFRGTPIMLLTFIRAILAHICQSFDLASIGEIVHTRQPLILLRGELASMEDLGSNFPYSPIGEYGLSRPRGIGNITARTRVRAGVLA